MFERVINATFRRLPAPVVNELIFRRDQFFKEAAVERWEEQGKLVPPPHIVKQRIIHYYQQKYGYDTLIDVALCLFLLPMIYHL